MRENGPTTSVLATSARWGVEVASWQGEDLRAAAIPVASGTWSVDSTRQVPESLTLTVPPGSLDEWVPGADMEHPLARYGQELDVTIVVTSADGLETWETAIGRAEIQEWTAGDPGDVEVSAVGILQRVADDRFPEPTSPSSGSTFVSEFRRLMTAGIPIEIDPGLIDRVVPEDFVWQEDRLSALYDLADAWPALIRVDSDGGVRLTPTLPSVTALTADLPAGHDDVIGPPYTLLRTNWAKNPRATNTAGTIWAYQNGTGEVSTGAFITNALDGPVFGLTSYRRSTTTTAKTGGSSGIYTRSATAGPIPGGKAGDVLRASLYVRPSVTRDIALSMTPKLAAANSGNARTGTYITCPGGKWTRLSELITTSAAYDDVQIWGVLPSGMPIPVGGTLDATGAQLEISSAPAGPFFDGETPDTGVTLYDWVGAVNASQSTLSRASVIERAVVLTFTDGVAGTVVSAPRSDTRAESYNAVVARATSSDANLPAIQAHAQVLSGPMAVTGPYGPVRRFYSSPLLETYAQCVDAAKSLLVTSVLPSRTIVITHAADPRIELYDPVRAIRDGVAYDGYVIAYTLPLTVGDGEATTTIGIGSGGEDT
jgi:hypothetical protein